MPRPPFSSARSARPSASAAAEATVDAVAIGPGEAARLFADCGPFEPRPQVAVAVSGGADSLALAWLLQRWLAGQGGRLHALIVDHRLRPGSAEEAADVSARLATLGIDSRILVWEGAAEVSAGVQAAARDARYSLLIEACRSAGVLHLALGHHRDDQVETLLQRANSGSGPDGLAAMPSVAELPDVRLIRPLLTVPKARLAATCLAAGLPFVEDPSNRDARFARSRLRAQAVEFALAGLAPEPLFSLATTAGRLRAELEQQVAALLAETVVLHPAGYARVAPALAAAPDALALRSLAQLLACIGGRTWPPRTLRSQRALLTLRERPQQAVTLGGCRLLPQRSGWLAVREPTAVVQPLAPGDRHLWDGRFLVALREDAPPGLSVGPLGEAGWQALVASEPSLKAAALPPAARVTLPTLFGSPASDPRRSSRPAPLVVPQLDFADSDWDSRLFSCRFRPRRSLTAAGFCRAQTAARGRLDISSGASFTVA